MKTSNLIKIASLILFGIFLNGTLQAESDKNHRYSRINTAKLTDSIRANTANSLHYLFVHPERADFRWSAPVEEWMFQTDYLDTETAINIESWMLDTNYFEEESSELESWMFSESRLSEKEADSAPKSWMFDVGYLGNK
jgi:glycosidase